MQHFYLHWYPGHKKGKETWTGFSDWLYRSIRTQNKYDSYCEGQRKRRESLPLPLCRPRIVSISQKTNCREASASVVQNHSLGPEPPRGLQVQVPLTKEKRVEPVLC